MKSGDIVKIFAPIAGYDKYHFCVAIPENGNAGSFLFLNSDPNFKDCLSVDCAKIPFLPVSETGKTAISFSIMMRYNDDKLRIYKASVLGEMPKDILKQMLAFVGSVTSLPHNDKKTLMEVLKNLN